MNSLIIGVAVIVGSSLAQADTRSPVPNKSELVESEKLVKSVFKADFAKTKAADRAALAAKLFEQAAGSKDDLNVKYVLLREARDMAAKAGDHEMYLKAADEMAADYKISIAEAKAAGVDMLVAGVAGADSARDAGQSLLETVDVALSAGEFDAAQKLLRGTDILGRKSGAASLTTAIGLRTKSLAALRKEYEKIADAQKKLETTPTDGAANLLVGKFLCFVKNDWENGLPRLLLGNDDGLRAAAEKDSKAATGAATDKVEAGESWIKLAATFDPLEKSNLEGRALHWFRKSLADISGLAKVKVEKRIEDLTKSTKKDLVKSTKEKDDKTKLTFDPKANYECLISVYKIDNKSVPFFNLTVPNGKSMLNDGIKEQFRGAKLSLGEFAFTGTGLIDIPADGAYEFDTNIGTVVVDRRSLGLARKSGSATFKKGTHAIELADNTHGQPYLTYSRIAIKNKETGTPVPIYNKGPVLQNFVRQFPRFAEVSLFVPEEHKLEAKTPGMP
jgi:hypothetical protein